MHDLRVLAHAFLGDLQAGDFGKASARFDGNLQIAVPLVALSNTWRRLQIKIGRLKSYERDEETRSPQHPEYRILLVSCEFERGNYTMRLWFNKDGRISGMSIDQLDPILIAAS